MVLSLSQPSKPPIQINDKVIFSGSGNRVTYWAGNKRGQLSVSLSKILWAEYLSSKLAPPKRG